MRPEDGMDDARRPGSTLRRRLVLALVVANALALGALAFVTLSGRDGPTTVSVSDAAGGASSDGTSTAPAPAEPARSPEATPSPSATVTAAEGEGDASAVGTDPTDAAAAPSPSDAPGAVPEGVERLQVAMSPPAGFLPVRDRAPSRSAGPFAFAVQFDPLHSTFPRSRLRDLGLEGIGQAGWQSPTDTLVAAVYRFPGDGAATAFVEEASAPWEQDDTVMAHDLSGVPGSRAFHQMDRGDEAQFALVARGPMVYVVGLTGPSAADHSMELVHQSLHQLGG